MDAVNIESPGSQHVTYSVECSICGHNHWSVAPELFELPVFIEPADKSNQNKKAKFALITCLECQNAQFVKANKLDMVLD